MRMSTRSAYAMVYNYKSLRQQADRTDPLRGPLIRIVVRKNYN
jgi:hypothetical protein